MLVLIFISKGDVQSCGNFRGIKLMTHTMKLWERVLEARLRTEVTIREQQYGFVPKKRTNRCSISFEDVDGEVQRSPEGLHCVYKP